MIRCARCGRDIDAIYQDNMSYNPGHPLCEDCSGFPEKDYYEIPQPICHRGLTKKQFRFLMRRAGWSYFKTKNTAYDIATRKIGQIIYMIQLKNKGSDQR